MSIPFDTDAQLAQLHQQNSILTAALRAFLAGRLDGPNSTKWILAALDPTGDMGQTVAPFEFGQ